MALPRALSTVWCRPRVVIRPSAGCQGLPAGDSPSRWPMASMLGFHRFIQLRLGPTTKAMCSSTGPGGSGSRPASWSWICSLYAVPEADTSVGTVTATSPGGSTGTGVAVSTVTHDRSVCAFVHQTEAKLRPVTLVSEEARG